GGGSRGPRPSNEPAAEGGKRSPAEPILDRQTGYTTEMTDVARDQGEPTCQDDRRNAEVWLVEPLAARLKFGSQCAIDVGGGHVEGKNGDRAGDQPAHTLSQP